MRKNSWWVSWLVQTFGQEVAPDIYLWGGKIFIVGEMSKLCYISRIQKKIDECEAKQRECADQLRELGYDDDADKVASRINSTQL